VQKPVVHRAWPKLAWAAVSVSVALTATSCTWRPTRPPATTVPTGPATTAPPGPTPTTTGPAPTTTAPPAGPGGAGPAVEWNPPAELRQPLADVWAYTIGRQKQWQTFKHFEWDQVMTGRGSLTYCVRWESNQTVTAAQRDQIAVTLERQFNNWMAAMTENGKGWNQWPYTHVKVNVVGWAVRNRATLQWTDTTVPVYTGVNDADGAPMCPASAGAGLSLWLTDSMEGRGTGGDWGQRIGPKYLLGALNQPDVHILEHEIGHGFGLEDFYDWKPAGVGGFVMNAGSATKITEFDKWMLRDWWRHLKSRYVS
jgi:hypothetical protein